MKYTVRKHKTGVLPFRLIPFRLIFTVSFRVTICLGLGIGLGSRLGELSLGDWKVAMGLGEMGQNLKTSNIMTKHVYTTNYR